MILPMCCPLRELATSGLETYTPQWAAVSASKKLSSAPESRSAEVFWAPPGHCRVTGRHVRLRLEDSRCDTPTSAPRSTSGRRLLPDRLWRSDPSPRTRSTPTLSGSDNAPLRGPGTSPPLSAQAHPWAGVVSYVQSRPAGGWLVGSTEGYRSGLSGAVSGVASSVVGPPAGSRSGWPGR